LCTILILLIIIIDNKKGQCTDKKKIKKNKIPQPTVIG